MKPYRVVFDHLLTRTDPERAHHAASRAIRAARPVTGPLSRLPSRRSMAVEAMGMRFPGVLGLAAGFDKNAESVDALAALGFAFVEVGTVTAAAQPGNERPRLFRLAEDRAIVNRMGFNNDGAEIVARRLERRLERGRAGEVIVGVNIGKTRAVPEEETVADYERSTRLVAPYADYLVVNVSSPNTPGLRDLQAVGRLKPLLGAVRETADHAAGTRHVPLLVKIGPDLSDDDVVAVADLSAALGLDGVVATNTTVSRAGLTTPTERIAAVGAGGLSGAPLRSRALEVTRLVRERLGHGPVIIGVGGIGSVQDARERLEAGATLVQAYSAFVYEGPLWPRRVQRQLAAEERRA